MFSAQVSYSATALDRAEYLDEIHLDVLAEAPYRAMLEALTLRFQPAYLNILPMYVVLLLLFAAVMPLLRRPAALAALSFALYAGARLAGVNLPSWTGGGWYFNPLTWQFLFVLGAILSYAPPGRPARNGVADASAATVVLGGLVLHWVVWPRADTMTQVPAALVRVLVSVDKESLHPFRLISILALAWLVARFVPAGAGWLRSRVATPFVLCGQHSLAVFCVGIFLSFLGRLAMEERGTWAIQAAVNLVGAAALVGVGALATWYQEKGRLARPALQTAAHADSAKVT